MPTTLTNDDTQDDIACTGATSHIDTTSDDELRDFLDIENVIRIRSGQYACTTKPSYNVT